MNGYKKLSIDVTIQLSVGSWNMIYENPGKRLMKYDYNWFMIYDV